MIIINSLVLPLLDQLLQVFDVADEILRYLHQIVLDPIHFIQLVGGFAQFRHDLQELCFVWGSIIERKHRLGHMTLDLYLSDAGLDEYFNIL